jgi:hypothetical protein
MIDRWWDEPKWFDEIFPPPPKQSSAAPQFTPDGDVRLYTRPGGMMTPAMVDGLDEERALLSASKYQRDLATWRMPAHESGHCNFYDAVKYRMDGVSLFERTIRGTTYPAHVRLTDHPLHNFHSLVGDLVGIAVEKELLGITYPADFESTDILSARQTATVLDKYGWADVMREGKAAAERFVRANRAHIEAFAETLQRRGEMDGFHIAVRINQIKNQLGPLTMIPPRNRPERLGVAVHSPHDGADVLRRIDGGFIRA